MTKTSTAARRAGRPSKRAPPAQFADPHAILVRPVRRADLDQVIAIDATVTGQEKRAYWQRVYRRYGVHSAGEVRHFLVAVRARLVVGFLIGEVRDWEFGSPPCGWVFAIDVAPEARQAGVGTLMLEAVKVAFRRAGVRQLRTLLSRDNTVILSFFRSQGMMAGPLISLEMDLGVPAAAAARAGAR